MKKAMVSTRSRAERLVTRDGRWGLKSDMVLDYTIG